MPIPDVAVGILWPTTWLCLLQGPFTVFSTFLRINYHGPIPELLILLILAGAPHGPRSKFAVLALRLAAVSLLERGGFSQNSKARLAAVIVVDLHLTMAQL